MNAEHLSLPASFNFYTSSRANRSALDRMMRKPDLPADLRWDEVLAFHDATLTAQRVQLDYFGFLYAVWEQTWGTAIKQLFPSAEQPTISDLAEWAPTLEITWNSGCVFSKIGLPQNRSLWSGVDCSDMKEVKLSFYVDAGGEDYSLSDNLMLSADWLPIDDEHYRGTAPGLCPIKTGKADPTKLAKASYEALDLVLGQLTKPAV
jgi:hypothetical protein